MTQAYYDEEHHEEDTEGYCMRCRESVVMEDPVAVWTRKGQPATRGTCPLCGGMVFRMGKTNAHDERQRPSALQIGDNNDKRTRAKLTRDTVYINYAPQDEERAQQIADDLGKSGLAVWLHESEDDTAWASAVHPALKACARMVLIWSAHTQDDASVQAAWQFFKDQRKPIVLAHLDEDAPPDPLRRAPRFVFYTDYKPALRQMLDSLSS